MNNFELEQAKENLEITKTELHEFLMQSYSDNADPAKATKDLIKYLDEIIEKIVKRQEINLEFTKGASPIWYAEMFKYLSNLIDQNMKICELLSKELLD